MVSERERHLIPYAHRVVESLFGRPLLVLEEARILFERPLKPDLTFLFNHEPYVVFVELEPDADNKYCLMQAWRYSFWSLTIVVTDHVSSWMLEKYRRFGIGLAIRDKILLEPKWSEYTGPEYARELLEKYLERLQRKQDSKPKPQSKNRNILEYLK